MTPLALAVLLLAPACTEADPCTLRITLDETGVWFDRPGDHDATVQQHHWYTLDVLNQFDEDHALTLGDETFTAGGYETGGPRSRHGPLPFSDAGTLTVRDETTGAEATLQVQEAAPPEPEPTEPATPTAGPTAPDDPGEPPERRKDVPASLAALPAVLLAAALRRR